MRGVGGGGVRSRVSGGDAEAQKALNATAPRIPHLFRRIMALFAPYRAAIALTMALVLIGPRCR
ncbi:hypothetical protein Lxx03180 [Leifsonia xyli subsp. xyli str. CTCB07]|uniref:Uncharacterized protein n=2 Tax=Leifsonia xyli subsp. xyli TaxID=59736 RepID=Q6AH08_LEIXX|nr:hypothetical protein Lxx03180 [Leifsonia xyli subsp. xyli str. CTCB07]